MYFAFGVQNGANMKQKDYDGLEPVSLLGDQLMTFKKEQGIPYSFAAYVRFKSLALYYIAVANVNLYTWGTNINTTLGHDHTRKHPEKLDMSQQIITQVRSNIMLFTLFLCMYFSLLLFPMLSTQ